MSSLGVFLLIAMRNLLQARRRTALLSVAIGLVTMLLVLLMSLTQGISDNLIRTVTTLSAGHVNVAGIFKATSSDAMPILQDPARVRAIVEEHTPGLDFVIDRNQGAATVISAEGSLQALLMGVNIDQERHFLDVVRQAEEREYYEGGRAEMVGDPSGLNQPNTALIFASQARRLNVTVGDVITLSSRTRRRQANTVDLTIVAVARDIGMLSNFAVFVPQQTILDLYQLSDSTSGAVLIYLHDIAKAEHAMGVLRPILQREGFEVLDHEPEPFFRKFRRSTSEDWTGQRLDLTTWEDEVSFMDWILTALDTISFLLIFILAVIIAIGIMNTMWIAVRERTRELGTVRAIGMTRREVLLLFMLEAALLGVFASAMGGLLGAIVATGVNAAAIPVPIDAVKAILLSDTLHLSVRWDHLLKSIIALSALTSLSALWPSWRASRLQPVDAIRTE